MKSDWQPSTSTPTWTDTCLIISLLCKFSILCVLYPLNIYLSFIFCIYNFMHLFILYLYILNTGQWLARLAQSRKIVACGFCVEFACSPLACVWTWLWMVACLSVLALQLTGSLSRAYPATGPVMAWIGHWSFAGYVSSNFFQANFCLIWSSALKYEIITFASHSLRSNCLLLFPSDLQAEKIK